MTEGSVVTDCWGELFYITPGLGLELGFDGPQGFPLPFHNELSVAMFLGTLPSFDLVLLNQRFSSSVTVVPLALKLAVKGQWALVYVVEKYYYQSCSVFLVGC
jgi:hypothetical protein